MIVGVPREIYPGARRVALVPSVLPLVTKAGTEVVVEALVPGPVIATQITPPKFDKTLMLFGDAKSFRRFNRPRSYGRGRALALPQSFRPVLRSLYKILTARAAIKTIIVSEISDCAIIPSFAPRDSTAVSVGENAVLVLKARKR